MLKMLKKSLPFYFAITVSIFLSPLSYAERFFVYCPMGKKYGEKASYMVFIPDKKDQILTITVADVTHSNSDENLTFDHKWTEETEVLEGYFTCLTENKRKEAKKFSQIGDTISCENSSVLVVLEKPVGAGWVTFDVEEEDYDFSKNNVAIA